MSFLGRGGELELERELGPPIGGANGQEGGQGQAHASKVWAMATLGMLECVCVFLEKEVTTIAKSF